MPGRFATVTVTLLPISGSTFGVGRSLGWHSTAAPRAGSARFPCRYGAGWVRGRRSTTGRGTLKLMKIYTRTGDDGSTGLFGGGRVAKDDLRVQAYGSVDEANSVLGLARAAVAGRFGEVDGLLERLQSALFDLGAELACPRGSPASAHLTPMTGRDVSELEATIDRLSSETEPLTSFILPGGHPAGAALHLARAVTRRAERAVVALAREQEVNPQVLAYLNRLSDLLFTLARVVNRRAGIGETSWTKRED